MKLRDIKKKARNTLKKHYLMLVLLCLICAILGTEFSNSLPFGNLNENYNNIKEFISDLKTNGVDEARKKADKRIEEEKENQTAVLGRSRGVFSKILNSFESGAIFVNIYSTILSISKSNTVALVIFISVSFLLYAAFWILVVNVFSVVARRIALEMRIYQKIPASRFLFLYHIRRIRKDARTMFLVQFYKLLWNLTIIGGIIKHYSYMMVPFILAENPDIGTRDAIKLSRDMMNGYKFEAFKLDLSFLGWVILSGLTSGITGILYSNPYYLEATSEFFFKVRKNYVDRKEFNFDLLNDKYLYKLPSELEILSSYPKETVEVNKPFIRLEYKNPIKRFFYDNFGIYFESSIEKNNEKYLLHQFKQEKYNSILEKKEYPTRLFTIPRSEKKLKIENINYMKHYSVLSVIMMFFIFSIGGWIWEVVYTFINKGVFINRGTMYGPWLPIYGSGCILILILLYRFRKKPYVEFIATIVLCGIIEYFTSYILEMKFGLKWWSYRGYFLNLNGRICAEGLLLFGIGGMAVVYLLAPLIDSKIQKLNRGFVTLLCALLVGLFIIDLMFVRIEPNTGKGITTKANTVVPIFADYDI